MGVLLWGDGRGRGRGEEAGEGRGLGCCKSPSNAGRATQLVIDKYAITLEMGKGCLQYFYNVHASSGSDLYV